MTAETRRMLWRCRRGLLELDLLLERFVSESYAGLNAVQRQAFDGLLDMPDNDLWELVCARSACNEPQQQHILAMIQESCRR